MSRYAQTFISSAIKGDTRFDRFAEFQQKFPNLADALVGAVNEEGKATMAKATLMIFGEGGKLKFCISPQGARQCAFGTVPDPLAVIEGIESELAMNHFEWKDKRSSK